MDEQPLLNGPEPEPQAGTAAEAFTRLAARVEAMDARFDGRLAVIARALEHIAIEKQGIEVPDYNPTLAKINATLAEFARYMKALSQSEALRMTPESMAERIAAVAEAAREADRIAIKQMREQNKQSNAAISKAVGTVRTKEDQRRHMLYAISGAILAVS